MNKKGYHKQSILEKSIENLPNKIKPTFASPDLKKIVEDKRNKLKQKQKEIKLKEENNNYCDLPNSGNYGCDKKKRIGKNVRI